MRGGGTRGEERQDGKGKKEGQLKSKGERKKGEGEEEGRRKMIYIYNIVAKCTACD